MRKLTRSHAVVAASALAVAFLATPAIGGSDALVTTNAMALTVQNTTQFKGTVLDHQGKPVKGIEVVLKPDAPVEIPPGMRQDRRRPRRSAASPDSMNLSTFAAKEYKTKTNDKGEFLIKDIEPDVYRYSVGTEETGMKEGMVNLRKNDEMEIKLMKPRKKPAAKEESEDRGRGRGR